MPEDKPEIEKLEHRVIEVNEWFTPFPNYDDIPYEIAEQNYRRKSIKVNVANICNLELELYWDQEMFEQFASEDHISTHLLVLPASAKLLDDKGLFEEQKQIESRILQLDIDCVDTKWVGRGLPITVELELPDGSLISAPILEDGVNPPTVMNNWVEENSQTNFFTPVIPEVENILGKIQMRFVLKD